MSRLKFQITALEAPLQHVEDWISFFVFRGKDLRPLETHTEGERSKE